MWQVELDRCGEYTANTIRKEPARAPGDRTIEPLDLKQRTSYNLSCVWGDSQSSIGSKDSKAEMQPQVGESRSGVSVFSPALEL